VLALLALVVFPVMAHAGQTPGETVYETAIPSATSEPNAGGNEKSATHQHKPKNNAPAEGSDAGTETGGSTGSEGGSGGGKKSSSQEGSSSEKESNPSMSGGGGGGNGNKPNGGGTEGAGTETGITGAQEVAPASTGTNASQSSGGGSSPVVPILIAVVVLAAISIGVVLYRQRKSGQGGSDGRVSSSNAS
jgi:cobalamin biosynthesis Mg chelatase CobN